MNFILASGNITMEPKLFSPDGSEYSKVTFSIANNDKSIKNRNTGEWESYASFIECECWTKNPQKWLQKLTKGSGVIVSGEWRQDRWDNEKGKGSKIVIEVKRWPEMLEKLDKQQSQAQTNDRYEDDIPF